MKKLLTILLTLQMLISLFDFVPNKTLFAQNVPYAKITKQNVAFYNSPLATESNVKFYLEQSYYVKLLERESDGFYKTEYIDEVGYVLKSDLVFVDGTPVTPFPTNISFRVFSLSGLNMRSSPVESGGPFNIITTIPFLENNLVYYGKVNGEEAVAHKGTIWYFAKYLQPNSQTQPRGYLYSVFCDMLSVITVNTEQLPVIEEPKFDIDVQTPSLLTTLPQYLQITIVFAVCLPCILIIYFLFKPTKISIDNGKRKNKKIKKLKGSDYYEIEE